MTNLSFSIPIIIFEEINYVFLKANSILLNQNKFNDNLNNEKKLEELWFQFFRARLIKNNADYWTDIVFDNEIDKTFFLIKYSV